MLWPLISIVATVIVFAMVVYLQSMKVEIPLSLGRVRGLSIKWPLKFIYTSNMPVILVAALIASMSFWGLMLNNMGLPLLGRFEAQAGGGQPVAVSGLAKYLNHIDHHSKTFVLCVASPVACIDLLDNDGYLEQCIDVIKEKAGQIAPTSLRVTLSQFPTI